VTPRRDGSREAKISSDDTKAFQSRDLSPSSLCVRVEATFSGMRHSPQVARVIMKPFPQHILLMAKLSRGSRAFQTIPSLRQIKFLRDLATRSRSSPIINGILRFLSAGMNISISDKDNRPRLIGSPPAAFCDPVYF